MSLNSEAAGHFGSLGQQNCVYPTPTTRSNTWSNPPRLRRVTTVTEYNAQGKKTKETRTEEWEHSPYYGTYNGNTFATFATSTTAEQ